MTAILSRLRFSYFCSPNCAESDVKCKKNFLGQDSGRFEKQQINIALIGNNQHLYEQMRMNSFLL